MKQNLSNLQSFRGTVHPRKKCLANWQKWQIVAIFWQILPIFLPLLPICQTFFPWVYAQIKWLIVPCNWVHGIKHVCTERITHRFYILCHSSTTVAIHRIYNIRDPWGPYTSLSRKVSLVWRCNIPACKRNKNVCVANGQRQKGWANVPKRMPHFVVRKWLYWSTFVVIPIYTSLLWFDGVTFQQTRICCQQSASKGWAKVVQQPNGLFEDDCTITNISLSFPIPPLQTVVIFCDFLVGHVIIAYTLRHLAYTLWCTTGGFGGIF